MVGAQGAELGDRHLELGEHLEEERLELVLGAVDLVDQQHGLVVGADRLQQRPRLQEAVGEERVLVRGDAVDGGGEVRRVGDDVADLVAQQLGVEQLLGVLPLVERLGLVEPLVALQANQLGAEAGRQRLGELGLADAVSISPSYFSSTLSVSLTTCSPS